MGEIMLGSKWQLFIDDYAFARTTGFDRVVHHPRPMGVVIPADKPWETRGVGVSLIDRREDGSFFGYSGYGGPSWWGLPIKPPGNDRGHCPYLERAYFESEDGIHWRKPNLGLVDAPAAVDWSNAPFPGPKGTTRENNLGVPFMFVADLGRFGNVSDPARRYALRIAPSSRETLATHQQSTRGYFAAELPDFINDPNWADKLIDSGGCFNPRRHLLHFWDNIHEEWVAMEQGVIGLWLPSREIARMASKDLVHWSGESVLYPDAADSHTPQYYDEPMSLTPFCAEDVVFGLLSWFHSDRSHPHGGPNLTDPTKHVDHPDHWPWCRKGTNEMRITISRDGGKTWDRTSSRQAWIPHGTEQDSYDRLVIGGCPPVPVGDEDWFYMDVIDGDHLNIRNNPEQSSYYHNRMPKHQVGLYIQKHNRYVSLRANNRQEVLISKPLKCSGGSLQLNVDAGRGEVRVAIASAKPIMAYEDSTPLVAPHMLKDNLLAGFTFGDCQPIYADSTEYTVRFKNGKNLDELQGKSVCLLFEMFDADLYGFRAIGDTIK